MVVRLTEIDRDEPREIVADARRLPLAEVLRLVGRHTTGRTFGFLGEKVVNVLALNLELDRAS